ncbi:MAG: O-antigen ligase family protein, partial [Acidobacteria bacterium]|nr:O-antigen ligase family protein [Acidobacteriota bacterium]
LLYFLAALHLLREGARRRQLMFVVSALGFALALFAIAQKLTYNGKLYWIRPVSPYVAPFGPYANYNHFAGAMELLLPIPLVWWLLARAEIGKRMVAFWAAVAMIVALVYSLSRGGLLALGVELAALFFFLWRERANTPQRMRSTQTPLLAGVALAVSFLLVLGLAYDQLAARFQLMQQGAQEYSLVTRRAFWADSWQMFRAHPFTGVGIGAFPTAYPPFGRSSAQNERLETVHNDYLQLLTDAGLVGAALLLWFLYEAARHLRHARRHWATLRSNDRTACLGGWLAVLGIAVHSTLDFNLQITANALMCLCLLALATSLSEKLKSEK